MLFYSLDSFPQKKIVRLLKSVCYATSVISVGLSSSVYAEDSPNVGTQSNTQIESPQVAQNTTPKSEGNSQDGSSTTSDTTPVLDEVVVTGSREKTQLNKTPAAIAKVNQKTLAEKKPTFIGQVLNQLPGVYMTDLGNEQHNMSVRHPLSYQAVYLYLEDGIPIRPMGLFNHNALYEMNLSGHNAIEVSKGPASSLYGGNAIGAAFNFLTKPGSGKFEANIGVQGSDQGFRRLDLGLGTPLGESQALNLSAYTSRQNGGWQDYNDADKRSVTLRHDVFFNANTQLKTVFTYNYLKTDMPGSLNQSDYENRPNFSYNTFTQRLVESTRLSTQLQGEWNQGGQTSITLFGRDNRTDQVPSYLIFNTSNPRIATGRNTDQNFTSLGFEAKHRQDFFDKKLRLIGGVVYDRSPMHGFEENTRIDRDPISGKYLSYAVTGVRRDYDVLVNNRAAYLQSEWTPIKQLTLVAGLRYDQIQYAYENHLTPSSTTGAPSETRRFHHTSPKIGGVWQLQPNIAFYSNYSQGFTPPEVSSQYGGSLSVPNLKPAVFNNIDAGIRWKSDKNIWQGDIGIYQLRGKDEIISYSLAPGLSEPRNAARTQHRGVEFSLKWQPVSQFSWQIAGAYSRHTYRAYQPSASLDFSNKEIAAAPKWLINSEMVYRPTENINLGVEVQRLGKYWMNDSNTVRYAGHTLLNLRAAWKLPTDQHDVEVWAKLNNASNRKYAEIAASSYTGVGTYSPNTQNTYSAGNPRTILVGFNYRFKGK